MGFIKQIPTSDSSEPDQTRPGSSRGRQAMCRIFLFFLLIIAGGVPVGIDYRQRLLREAPERVKSLRIAAFEGAAAVEMQQQWSQLQRTWRIWKLPSEQLGTARRETIRWTALQDPELGRKLLQQEFEVALDLHEDKDQSFSKKVEQWESFLRDWEIHKKRGPEYSSRLQESRELLNEARVAQEREERFLSEYAEAAIKDASLESKDRKDLWYQLLTDHRGVGLLSPVAESAFIQAREGYDKALREFEDQKRAQVFKEAYEKLKVDWNTFEAANDEAAFLKRSQGFLEKWEDEARKLGEEESELIRFVQKRIKEMEKKLRAKEFDQHSAKGEVLFSKSDFRGAAIAWSKAVHLDPSIEAIRFRLAEALFHWGSYRSAIHELEKILKQNPEHAGAIGLRALTGVEASETLDIIARDKLIARCRITLENLSEDETGSSRFLVEEGLALLLSEMEGDAQKEAQTLFEDLSRRGISVIAGERLMKLNTSQSTKSKYAKSAIRYLSDAIDEWGNGSPRLYMYRARCHLQQGNNFFAKRDHLKALELNPDYLQSYLGLAELAYVDKDEESAAEYLKSVRERARGMEGVLVDWRLARHELEHGDIKKAKERYDKLFAVQPSLPGLEVERDEAIRKLSIDPFYMVAISLRNPYNFPIFYEYRWGEKEWTSKTLNPFEQWFHTSNCERDTYKSPLFQIKYDSERNDTIYSERTTSLDKTKVPKSDPSKALEYCFSYSGDHLSIVKQTTYPNIWAVKIINQTPDLVNFEYKWESGTTWERDDLEAKYFQCFWTRAYNGVNYAPKFKIRFDYELGDGENTTRTYDLLAKLSPTSDPKANSKEYYFDLSTPEELDLIDEDKTIQPLPNTFTFRIANRTGGQLFVKFYSEDRRGHQWPGPNKRYEIRNGEVDNIRIEGIKGEKVCYGAWTEYSSGKVHRYWGVGRYGTEICKKCCYNLDGGKSSWLIMGRSN